MNSLRIDIVNLDIKDLIAKLNKALSDEWLAYYQYWIASKIIKGPLRGIIAKELMEHAQDELRHAELLADRIVQLNGIPVISPQDWLKENTCGFIAPKDADSYIIAKQTVQSEQCAIKVYHELLAHTKGKDVTTFHILLEILNDEIDHEEDFEGLLEDLESLKK